MNWQAAYADEAFRTGRRRRAARGAVDTLLDAALAIGGLVLANAALRLGLGLPEGRAGISLGLAVLSLAVAAVTGTRRRTTRHARPVVIPVRTTVELAEAA